MKRHVLVLNADFTPMSTCTVEHAFRMINRGVAFIEEEHPVDKINGFWPIPTKLRLLRYVRMDWYYAKPVLWSKSGVMLRDKRKCAYCKGSADTIDHIWPQSRGGKSTWQNTVASCMRCNQKKNDRTLEELGWRLPFEPRVPSRMELHTKKLDLAEAKLI